MSRAGGHVSKVRTKQPPPMDTSRIPSNLVAGLDDLDVIPIQSKYESRGLLDKILKDRQKEQQRNDEEQKKVEEMKARGNASEDEEEAREAEEAARRAKHEEQAANDLAARRFAAAGPPIFAQVLHPADAPAAKCEFDAETPIVQECCQMLGEDAEKDLVDALAEELLLGGWLLQHYLRQGGMPDALQKDLLVLASGAESPRVAHKAFETLNTVLLSNPEKLATGLYGDSQPTSSSQCGLTDKDFIDAFLRLGVTGPSEQAKRPAKARKKSKEQDTDMDGEDKLAAPVDFPGWEDCSKPPPLQELNHVLVLLNTSARLQAAGKSNGLGGLGNIQLLITVLSLRLDPICCTLAPILEETAVNLIDSVDESDWSLKFASTVGQLTQLGGSYRGAVETLRFLGIQESSRAKALCNHGVAQIIPTLLLPKGAQGPKVRQSRGTEQVNPEDIVKDLKWWDRGSGWQLLSRQLRDGEKDSWEIRAVMELMEFLLFPAVKESERNGKACKYESFLNKWHHYMNKLGQQMKPDVAGLAIKLMTTTLLSKLEN